MTSRFSRLVRLSLLAATIPSAAFAQGQSLSGVQQAGAPRAELVADSLVRDSAQTAAPANIRVPVPSVFTKRDLAIATGFTAAGVALFSVDGAIARWAQHPTQQNNGSLKGAMHGAEWAVERGSLITAAGLWGTGLVTRNRTVAGMGFHTLAAMGVSSQLTNVLKGAFGRSRPYVTPDTMSHDWDMGAGFSQGTDRRSFPSGHTSQAFAFATALSHEINHAWPRAGKIATPVLYAGATAAGVARIYHDKHWASDVALGAAVGILSARATIRFLHGRPDNFFDRIALHTTIVPDGKGGGTLAIRVPTK
jgi:membrane-associated phospholipid phosphatase